MAKQIGPDYFIGKMGGRSYYRHCLYEYLVRRPGGPSGKQFKKSAAFAGSRQRSNEFGYCAKVSAEVRRAVIRQTGKKDPELYGELMKLVRRIMAQDLHSRRGESCVTEGLKTEAGQVLARGFKKRGVADFMELLQATAVEIERTWVYLRPFKTEEVLVSTPDTDKPKEVKVENKQKVVPLVKETTRLTGHKKKRGGGLKEIRDRRVAKEKLAVGKEKGKDKAVVKGSAVIT